MGDAGLQPIFESLELGFEVALARDEEEAASDLTLTLRQAQSLREILERRPVSLRLGDSSPARVTCIGRDFVLCAEEGLIAPLGAGSYVVGSVGVRPQSSPETLLEKLRALVRSGDSATFLTPTGAVRGRVAAAGSDHVEIESGAGPVLMPLGQVVLVRLCRGGSVDAS